MTKEGWACLSLFYVGLIQKKFLENQNKNLKNTPYYFLNGTPIIFFYIFLFYICYYIFYYIYITTCGFYKCILHF